MAQPVRSESNRHAGGVRKAIIVIPAYNVGQVLPQTISELPPGCADEILVVDDGSHDSSGRVAKQMGLLVITHEINRGYGAAQKSGYREALKRGADTVVLVHGDNQYDPSLVPQFISKIRDEGFDVVTGTRMVLGDALRHGMPIWKYVPNRLLTLLENWMFGTHLTDYHNGFRAYSAPFLETVPLELLSDFYDFDTDILIQASLRKCRIAEIPNPTRYRNENQQMPFGKGVQYGWRILSTVFRYLLNRMGVRVLPIYSR